MEKFQLSIQNLNNLWSFIEVYAVFVPTLCGEKSVRKKSLWRKNDKYEVLTFFARAARLTSEEAPHTQETWESLDPT